MLSVLLIPANCNAEMNKVLLIVDPDYAHICPEQTRSQKLKTTFHDGKYIFIRETSDDEVNWKELARWQILSLETTFKEKRARSNSFWLVSKDVADDNPTDWNLSENHQIRYEIRIQLRKKKVKQKTKGDLKQTLKRFSFKKLNTFYSKIIFRANVGQFIFMSFSIFITAVN